MSAFQWGAVDGESVFPVQGVFTRGGWMDVTVASFGSMVYSLERVVFLGPQAVKPWW